MIKDIEIKNAWFFPKPNSNYKEVKSPFPNSEKYIKCWTFNGLLIMASVAEYDEKETLHISFSRKSRLPSYEEMQMIKRDFIGEDKKAIFVLPKKENYVNINKNCLHLWCMKDDIIPNFDNGMGTI